MEGENTPQNSPVQNLPGTPDEKQKSGLAVIIFILVIIAIATGLFIWIKKNQSIYKQFPSFSTGNQQASTQISPKYISPYPTIPSYISCTADKDCPNGLSCELRKDQIYINPDTAGSSSAKNVEASGSSEFTDSSGFCKVKNTGVCWTNKDCLPQYICHTEPEGDKLIKRCREPRVSQCSGPKDQSCPAGYNCVQGCTLPIYNNGENIEQWYCQANEIPNSLNNCPK